jgi:hypothetical protein
MRYNVDTYLSTVDASFLGESAYDNAGYSVNGAGDVNGDGYDDIIISAHQSDRGGNDSGQAYLIFGKASGWSMDINLSNADASFYGENPYDTAGGTWVGWGPVDCVDGAGDVNGDGYDDILIGADANDDGGIISGKAYLIFGNNSGWSMYTNLSNASASFIGENAYEYFGSTVAGVGDVNGDGYDDILLGAWGNAESAYDAGKAYLIFGKSSGWTKDFNLSNADVAFLGESNSDWAGWGLAGAGDVNGDGYDDILINSQGNDDGGVDSGQTYLILGKATGWLSKSSLSTADASFLGESAYDYIGTPSKGVGDVNGDGFDDILIGGWGINKAYLIFGKASGWVMNTDLSKADASFVGEISGDNAGDAIAGVGDINFDGYDDILIGARYNNEGGTNAGQVYIIYGNSSGWSKNMQLSKADASFIGENTSDMAGWSVANAGDVNGDGVNDILIGALFNDENHNDSGQVYLIFPNFNFEPKVISSVKAYSDPGYSNEINVADIDRPIYIELIGLDENTTHIDYTKVKVATVNNLSNSFEMYLVETGNNTDTYQGSFRISDYTHQGRRFIKAELEEDIIITSVVDPTKSAVVKAHTPVQIRPLLDKLYAIEDEEYRMGYWAYGYNTVSSWTFESNGTWLAWDSVNHEIYGTPTNVNIGIFQVRLNITDGLGNFDEHNFTIKVNNTPPNITNNNILTVNEDEQYYVDYNSSDDGQGTITWHLETNASWLNLNQETGELSGTPLNKDTGLFSVSILVDDGNGGSDTSQFELKVIDINDPPVITTENISEIFEDELYYVQYNATDIDDPPVFEWYLNTNGTWLEIDNKTGVLSGTPSNKDVGTCFVNITVEDFRSGSDFQNFTLVVFNVNDQPEWIKVPKNTVINESELFVFDVYASDDDSGDTITYSISSTPSANISIDPDTGQIEWLATRDLEKDPPYVYDITLYATDGKDTISKAFRITVIANFRPTTNLLSPKDGDFVSALGTELIWEGLDAENNSMTFDVYFGNDFDSIFELEDSVRVLHNTTDTSFTVGNLEIDIIYYWTVIPHDGQNFGICVDGIFSVEINTPPTIAMINNQKATVGIEFQYEVEASDINPGHKQNFAFSLKSGPEGMIIDSNSGIISWNPTKAQLGSHSINVYVSDGLDQSNLTFVIEVFESEKKKETDSGDISSIWLIAIIIIVIIVILLLFMLMKKKKKDEVITETIEKPEVKSETIQQTKAPDEAAQFTSQTQTYPSAEMLYQDLTYPEQPQQDLSIQYQPDYYQDEPQQTEFDYINSHTASDLNDFVEE